MPLSPAQAAQHLLNRRRARADLCTYAGVIDVPGRPVADNEDNELFYPIETNLLKHHLLICKAIEETSRTRYGRLMIFAPPGAAKSSYASVVFPSKYLGEAGRRRLILVSYDTDLARKMGRRTRSIIKQPRYKALFNTELTQESSAADQFSLTNGSEYMASGLLSGITGNRADGAIVDDPVRGREDANSETMRNKTYEAYKDDLLTRLLPGAWVVLIMTRWHQEDLGGMILPPDWNGESGVFEGRDKMQWRVLSLQAKCETHTDPLGRQIGEYLAPEWFDAQHWSQHESDPPKWNSLFQQRPRPPEGAYFLEQSLLVDGEPIATPIHVDYVFAVIDSAMKTGKDHDGTAVIYCARSATGITFPMVILDWDIQQMTGASLETWLPTVFDRLEGLAAETKARVGSVGAYIEDKVSGTILLQQAITHGWPAQAIDSKLTNMGKTERAQSASPHVSAGDVKITEHAYRKTMKYKGSTKNHLLSQVLQFSPDIVDMGQDDALDTFTYATVISLGNSKGF